MSKNIKNIIIVIIILLFLTGIGITTYLYFSSFSFEKYFENITLTLNQKIIIVIIVYLFRNYLLLPSTVIILFAGYLLQNFTLTLVLSILGVSFGIFQSYFIGKVFSKDSLEQKKDKGLILKYNDKIQKDGFKVIFVGSLFPIIPVDLLYLSAGYVKYSAIKTFLAGILGELPLIILYSYLGKESSKYEEYFTIVGLIIFILFLLYLYLKRLFFK
ncbi:TVP38/TMEM64 family protein [Candidatus Gracilibacteria bacterium]|nr:TVP38/TMEM64 family protein [Candidatus Gracilibacteria bacterium]